MRVVPVPVGLDCYAYLLIDDATKTAAAVDPSDVCKVNMAAQNHGVQVVALITTHSHVDPSGGNEEFANCHPNIPVYGGSPKVPALTHQVKDKEELNFGEDIQIRCMATPCHTQDSFCFYVEDKKTGQRCVFTGDTILQAGCGRFFEGTAEEMHKALTYLSTLPDDTVVYNGHEYTAASVEFGSYIDPENKTIKALRTLAESEKITAGKSTILDEKHWNVFMRPDSKAVQNATGETDQVKAIGKLREMKNNYRGRALMCRL